MESAKEDTGILALEDEAGSGNEGFRGAGTGGGATHYIWSPTT